MTDEIRVQAQSYDTVNFPVAAACSADNALLLMLFELNFDDLNIYMLFMLHNYRFLIYEARHVQIG